MKTRKSLYSVCLAALLLSFLEVTVWAGDSKSQIEAPRGWPTKLDKRKLYSFEHGLVYAGSKSSAAKINKVIESVMKELDRDNIKTGTRGLVLVMDTKEKPPFDVEDLLTRIVREENEQKGNQETTKALKSLTEGKEKFEELGLDMNLLLSIAPMSVEPNFLPELNGAFPKDSERLIDWCVTIPTDRFIRQGMKKMLNAGMKKEKIGLVKRAAMLPLIAIAEHKAVDKLKKARWTTLQQLLQEKHKSLTEEHDKSA